jgi:hypothetical protein
VGGRFPALAVFGLPALTVAIALFVLWGLRPWEDDSAGPQMVPLGIEMGIGEGNALHAAPVTSVAAGTAVRTGPKAEVGLAESTGGRPAGSKGEDGPRLAVAPGQAVAVSTTEATPAPAKPAVPTPATPEAKPIAAVPTTPATAPVAAPIATTAEGTGSGGGPISAGSGGGLEESCEGDEYLLTITLLDEGPAGDETPVDIVLARLDEDGTTDELHLEGDLGDARSLASTLSSEENCLRIEIVQLESDDGAEEAPEASEEVPASGEEAAEPAEPPVSILP